MHGQSSAKARGFRLARARVLLASFSAICAACLQEPAPDYTLPRDAGGADGSVSLHDAAVTDAGLDAHAAK